MPMLQFASYLPYTDGYIDIGLIPKEKNPIEILLNRNAIIRRLSSLIYQYEEANEDNEMQFSQDVDQLISQIEIYDQIWYARHMPEDHEQQHSEEAVALVIEFVEALENISDGCAETFPFETIEEQTREYLI